MKPYQTFLLLGSLVFIANAVTQVTVWPVGVVMYGLAAFLWYW